MEYGKETVKTMKHEVKNIKGVKVNGKYYVTCGAVYIMNDKGQTIQRI